MTLANLAGYPKLVASWEGFVIEQMDHGFENPGCVLWGTHGGAELDLMILFRGKFHGFQVKYADAPGTTKAMHVAPEDRGLGLEHLWVVYPAD